MATTNKVKGWTGVLMTEDFSSHWPIKRRYVYSETSRRAGLEFVCIFGHDEVKPIPFLRNADGHRVLSKNTNELETRVQVRPPTQLLLVGKGFRKQPPRRCQESILPGNAFPPVVGDGVQAVEGAGELPRHCCYRIGIVG